MLVHPHALVVGDYVVPDGEEALYRVTHNNNNNITICNSLGERRTIPVGDAHLHISGNTFLDNASWTPAKGFINKIKYVHRETGCPLIQAKIALHESKGCIDTAIKQLRNVGNA